MSTPKTYQQLQQELDTLLTRLQDDSIDIDEATKIYKKATGLITELKSYLEKAENTISTIKKASS